MPLEEADKKFIAELITSSLGEFAKGDAFKGAINGTVAGAIKGLKLDEKLAERDEKLKALEEAGNASGDGGGNKADKGSQGKSGDADSPELRRLNAKLEEQAKQIENEKRARLESEEARKTERLRGATRDALAKAGVSAERIRHAMALLQTDGRIALDDNGTPVMKFAREWGEESIPLDKGLAEWVKTDDGKVYLPATGTQGTGGGAGGTGGQSGSTVPRTKDGALDMGAIGERLAKGLQGVEFTS